MLIPEDSVMGLSEKTKETPTHRLNKELSLKTVDLVVDSREKNHVTCWDI